jgi:hypothetical protein
MAGREGGVTKVFRGLLIAVGVVAAIVLVAVFWSEFRDALVAGWSFLADHFPTETNLRTAVIVYLVLAAAAAVAFSKAGHFTAYGIATGLGSLLWFLFWEGFHPLGLSPTWTGRMGLRHMDSTSVVLWAVVAALVITLVFVPLELGEKRRKRRHWLEDAG